MDGETVDARTGAALSALLASKKYAMISPDVVRRVFFEELPKRKNLKEVDKATRAALHQMTGAFLTAEDARAAAALANEYAAGDADALRRALGLHASTRERLAGADALYDRAFRAMGRPESVLDLACGLNPLCLGARGIAVRGVDASVAAAEVVNAWAARLGWDVRARAGDLMGGETFETDGAALLMKLLPLLERQKKGAAAALLRRVAARAYLVTFPTRTLSGRDVGMTRHYAEWFQSILPEEMVSLDSFVEADELCFVLARRV